MKFLVTFRPNWWIIGAIFEEICIYVEENEGFGQPLIPFILLIGELQMGPYMVTYWCVSECCSLIGSHRLYVYRNASREWLQKTFRNHPLTETDTETVTDSRRFRNQPWIRQCRLRTPIYPLFSTNKKFLPPM